MLEEDMEDLKMRVSDLCQAGKDKPFAGAQSVDLVRGRAQGYEQAAVDAMDGGRRPEVTAITIAA